MPIELATNIGPIIPNIFAREGARLWNREAPLFRMAKKVMGHSSVVAWSASNGGAVGSNVYVGEGEAVNTANEFNVDDITALTLSRAIVRNGFQISHTELAQVASMRPDMAANIVVNRLKEAWTNNLTGVARVLEKELLVGLGSATSNSTGSGVTGLFGLMSVFKPVITGTGSYAGKTVSSYSGLQPTVTNLAAGSLTTKALDQLIAAMQTAAGSIRPNFIMCTPKSAIALKQLGDQFIRLTANSSNPSLPWDLGLRDVATPDQPLVTYSGIPVIQNSAWGSAYDGYFIVGNMDNLEIDILPYGNWGDSLGGGTLVGVEGFNGLVQSNGVPFNTYAYAKQGSSVAFVQEAELQLKIKAPNKFGLLYNVNVS